MMARLPRTLFSTEDHWAVWLACGLLALGMAIFLVAKPANLEHKLVQANREVAPAKAKANLGPAHTRAGELTRTLLSRPGKWRNNPRDAFRASPNSYNRFITIVWLGLGFALLFGFAVQIMEGNGLAFLKGFPIVMLLAVLAYFIAAQADIKALGIGYAAWAILLGLVVSNTLGTPDWLKPGARTEFFIKTGLVLLGAEILFGKVLAIGLPGLFIAWVVTPVVLITTYWFGQKILKLTSRTLNITISADMSVCGVSAAIAVAAACRAKKEELTLAVGISMVFTTIMMIVMPLVIQALGMHPVLGGAWLGGTIDATGAVAAAGAFLGEKALRTAATIKMIQNILVGVIAFAVAVYWVSRVENTDARERPAVGPGEIWRRLPKFVPGFILVSIVFSLYYEYLGPDMGNAVLSQGVVKSFSKSLRGWFFCLAFVSIGLSTNFRELSEHLRGGKALLLYVLGQAFNMALTLGMAWFMFFIVFPEVTARI